MKKKILVLDDEELIIKTMSKLLEKNDYETIILKRGQDAIVLAEEEQFDLIISDIRMPGENGIEVITQIFDIIDGKGEKRPPVIFITGYADKELEEAAKKLNPAGYIYKPFDLNDILQKLNEIFS